MSLINWNKNNILKFSIDHTKIDEDLYDFPVLLNLTEESGQNDFDCSGVFEELNSNSKKVAVVYPSVQEHLVESLDDDFTGNDGEELNSYLWNSSDWRIQNNRAELEITDGFESVYTKYRLHGDLSFRTNYSMITGPSTATWQLGLRLVCYNSDESAYSLVVVVRRYDDTGHQYLTNMYESGSGWAGAHHVATSDTSGKLRIDIIESKVKTLYLNNGEWEELYTYTLNNTHHYKLGFYIESYYNDPTVKGSIDNFRVTSYNTIDWLGNPPHVVLKSYVHREQEQLFCEIERWDHVNKSAQLWVKVPKVLSDQPTDIYLYYDKEQDGNDYYVGYTSSTPAKKVWDDNYVGVWHLSQDPSGGIDCILDSTSNENHGTPNGSMTSSDLVDAIVGKGLDFDGSNDYINCGDNGVLDITDNLTLECTFNSNIKIDSSSTSSVGLMSHQRSSTDSYCYIINGDGKLHIGTQGGNIQSTKNSWAKNIYFYTASTYRSSDLSGDIYIDGTVETLSVDNYDSMSGADNELWIARHDSGYFNGIISEVRLSKTVRTASWLKTTYYNNYDNICNITESDIYIITGYITEMGSPVQREVFLYNRTSGELIDKTISDEKGYYLLRSPYNTEHNIVCLDAEAEPDYNDLIISKVKPNGVL